MATNLKPASIVAVVVLIILTPAIQNELRDKAATYVNDSESSHDGLPDSWDNQQVLRLGKLRKAPVGYPMSQVVHHVRIRYR
jgi:hypothetical protein